MNLSIALKHGLLILALALGILTSAGIVSAQAPELADQATNLKFNTRDAFPGSFGSQKKQNDLDDLAGRVISLALQLLATVGIAVCIFGSVRMVTSLGNSGALKKGQDAFMNAVIGTIIILLSYVIVAFVRDLILQVK